MRCPAALPALLLTAAASCDGEPALPEPEEPAAAARTLSPAEFLLEAARRLLAGDDLSVWCAENPTPPGFEASLEEVFAAVLDDQAWFEERAAREGNAWDAGAAAELGQLAAVLEEIHAACVPGAASGPGLPEAADATSLLDLLAVYLPSTAD